MGMWALLPTDQLWRCALAAIPLALLIAMVARFVPCRPATRHALWLFVLLWLIAGPWLPAAPRINFAPLTSPASEDATATLFPQHGSQTIHPRTAERSAARLRWSASRLRYDDGPSTPFTLAQATGPGGPPTDVTGLSTDPSVETRFPLRSSKSAHPTTIAARHVDEEPAETQAGSRRTPSIADPTKETPTPRDRAITTPRAALPRPAKTLPDTPADNHVPPASGAERPSWMVPARDWLVSLAAVRDSIGKLPAIPAGLWLAGAFVIALFACIRVLRFQSLLASAAPAPGSVKRLVAREAASMKLRSVPDVLFAKRRMSPMIWCGRRVRLILPVALWAQLDEIGRRAVVLHELAHVRRRDHWVSRVELLIGAMYWWYPLVWWVRGRMHAEAEECCDAWVTSLLPRNRRAYAEALLRTKQYVQTGDQAVPLLGIGITNGRAERFARRLTMVMTRSVRPGRSLPGMALVMIVAATTWLAVPAQSCPDDAGSQATAGPVADTSIGCRNCKHRKHAEQRRAATKKCVKCKAGKDCKHCKSGAPCKGCAKRLGLGAKSGSTFDHYLAAKKLTINAYTNADDAVGYTVVSPDSVEVRVVKSGEDENDLEERMERLERHLERLGEQLERITEGGLRTGRGHGKGHGDFTHRRRRAKRRRGPGPHAERRPWAPRAPRPSRAPRPPRAPHADHFFGPGFDGGRSMVRVYELPQGKLEALTALMARDDVPIVITPRDHAIEVRATVRQHRIFRAFINMIHPAEKSSDRGPEIPFTPDVDDEHHVSSTNEPLEETVELEVTKRAQAAVEQALQAAVHKHQVAVQEAQAVQHAQARQALAKSIQIERKVLREQMRQIERQSDSLRDQAEGMLDAAEELRDQAEEMRDQAEDLRGEIENASGDERRGLMTKAEALLTAAMNLDQEARAREKEGAAIEKKAEAIQEQAERLETRAEQVDASAASTDAPVSDAEKPAAPARIAGD